MEEEQIEQLRIDIKTDYEHRIAQLKREMEMELSSLDRLEGRLKNFQSGVKLDLEEKASSQLIRRATKTAFDLAKGGQSVRQILITTLDKMETEFGRDSLRKVASEEGGINIKNGTFSPTFAGLVKKGIIEVVREGKGSRPGLYKKGELVDLSKSVDSK
jgi:hypothetical protein